MTRNDALVVLLAMLLVACGSAPAGTGGTAEHADEHAVEPRSVIVVAKDLAFEPARIELVAGQPVELTLSNEGALEHDLSIMHLPVRGEIVEGHHDDDEGHADEDQHADEHDMGHLEEMPELHLTAAPGDHGELTFTPAEAGEYVFFCAVPGHREAGMEGTLVVVEK